MTRIVFSKDRALQLHAFLRSYATHVTPFQPITVLYLAGTARHERAYRKVFDLCPWATPHPQTEFRDDVLGLLAANGPVILFADDHLFLRHWDAETAPVGTNLHLGLNLTHCYTQNVAQPVPAHTMIEPDLAAWRWGDGILDWGYPLCPCGQVYDAAEFRQIVSCVQFHSPNSLEAALQVFAPSFWDRYGLCYRESKLVLLPWNLVQTDAKNRHADGPSADELLTRWEQGCQINVGCLYGTVTSSVHQALPLVLEAR